MIKIISNEEEPKKNKNPREGRARRFSPDDLVPAVSRRNQLPPSSDLRAGLDAAGADFEASIDAIAAKQKSSGNNRPPAAHHIIAAGTPDDGDALNLQPAETVGVNRLEGLVASGRVAPESLSTDPVLQPPTRRKNRLTTKDMQQMGLISTDPAQSPPKEPPVVAEVVEEPEGEPPKKQVEEAVTHVPVGPDGTRITIEVGGNGNPAQAHNASAPEQVSSEIPPVREQEKPASMPEELFEAEEAIEHGEATAFDREIERLVQQVNDASLSNADRVVVARKLATAIHGKHGLERPWFSRDGYTARIENLRLRTEQMAGNATDKTVGILKGIGNAGTGLVSGAVKLAPAAALITGLGMGSRFII